METLTLALILWLGGRPALEPVDRSAAECAFEHAQYAGRCVERVTPAEKQTPLQACRAVLACLNDPRCVKTYCNATTLRGGWRLVSPNPEARSSAHLPGSVSFAACACGMGH